MNALWFSLIVIVCYFVGNINFSRLFVKWIKHEDITTKGSGNPGFTNVLRNYDIGLAVLVLVCEVLKAGVPALVCGYLLASEGLFEVAFFTAGVAAVIGNDFPVLYKFKGGKGIACTVGMFLFSPLWYVALFMCAVYLLIVYFLDYGVVGSLVFVSGMSIAWIVCLCVLQPYLWWVALILVVVIWALSFIQHRSNIARLARGTENHTGFKEKIQKLFGKKQTDEGSSETPEKEIVVEDEPENSEQKAENSESENQNEKRQ